MLCYPTKATGVLPAWFDSRYPEDLFLGPVLRIVVPRPVDCRLSNRRLLVKDGGHCASGGPFPVTIDQGVPRPLDYSA